MRGQEWILAVDPGKVTGIAGLHRHTDTVELRFSSEEPENTVASVIRPMVASWRELEAAGTPLRVVIERFTITVQTAKNSQAPFSLEVIGRVKQCLEDVGYPVDTVLWQFPSSAKESVSNKRLRALNLWHKGGDGHANDAIRHAVLALMNRGWVDSRFLD